MVELSKERIGEISNLSKQIDYKNLVDSSNCKDITPIIFFEFRGPMHIYNNIKNGNTSTKITRRTSKTISIKSKWKKQGAIQRVRHIVHYFHQSKELLRKYTITYLSKYKYKMNTKFMKSENN